MLKKLSPLALLLLGACTCGGDVCENVDASSAVAPGTAADFKQNVRDRVLFAFDSAKVQDSAKSVLDQQAAWFKVHTAATSTVEGHCDSRGSAEYNLALGEKRAHAAADYLKHQGVDNSRLKIVSYGKNKQPVADATTEEQHAQNRAAITVVN